MIVHVFRSLLLMGLFLYGAFVISRMELSSEREAIATILLITGYVVTDLLNDLVYEVRRAAEWMRR